MLGDRGSFKVWDGDSLYFSRFAKLQVPMLNYS